MFAVLFVCENLLLAGQWVVVNAAASRRPASAARTAATAPLSTLCRKPSPCSCIFAPPCFGETPSRRWRRPTASFLHRWVQDCRAIRLRLHIRSPFRARTGRIADVSADSAAVYGDHRNKSKSILRKEADARAFRGGMTWADAGNIQKNVKKSNLIK